MSHGFSFVKYVNHMTTLARLTLLFIWRRSLVSVVIAHALINTLVLTL